VSSESSKGITLYTTPGVIAPGWTPPGTPSVHHRDVGASAVADRPPVPGEEGRRAGIDPAPRVADLLAEGLVVLLLPGRQPLGQLRIRGRSSLPTDHVHDPRLQAHQSLAGRARRIDAQLGAEVSLPPAAGADQWRGADLPLDGSMAVAAGEEGQLPVRVLGHDGLEHRRALVGDDDDHLRAGLAHRRDRLLERRLVGDHLVPVEPTRHHRLGYFF
jgi:hypothetical protein